MASSAPQARARSSRSSSRSVTRTRTPCTPFKTWRTVRPIGPAPYTRATSFGKTPVRLVTFAAIANGSTVAAHFSSMVAGTTWALAAGAHR